MLQSTNQSRYLGDRLTFTYVALDSRPKGTDLTKQWPWQSFCGKWWAFCYCSQVNCKRPSMKPAQMEMVRWCHSMLWGILSVKFTNVQTCANLAYVSTWVPLIPWHMRLQTKLHDHDGTLQLTSRRQAADCDCNMQDMAKICWRLWL